MKDDARHTLRDLNGAALDPTANAVVSACAGSGKTWLLVSRIIRLLLAGVEPHQILAITFTRKAAQEMAARLNEWMRDLATRDDAAVREFLEQRELPAACVDALRDRARALFELALTAEPPITITTFHSWFLQLLRNAPLEAGALGAVALVDRTSGLIGEAWERLMISCRASPQDPTTLAVEALFRDYGLENARRLLRNFVARRAEWWTYAGARDDPVQFALERIEQRMTAPADADVLGELLADAAFIADVRDLARLLAHHHAPGRRCAEEISRTLAGADLQAAYEAISRAVYTDADRPRSTRPTHTLAVFAGADAEARLQRAQAAVRARLQAARTALADQASYRANGSALTAGVALLAIFQALKRERQLVDFADVEWLAYAMLTRSEHAVTMQFRLDSRYRHILLDEFQDTNPLQWLALRAWFDAALETGEPPGLFVVGDPKQSIYRFRGAQPELFDAARHFVAEQGGRSLAQDESFRCAQPVLDVVNRLFAAQPLFQPFNRHAAHYPRLPGRVEVQALAQQQPSAPSATPAPNGIVLRDPLRNPAAVIEDLRRASEARTFAQRVIDIVGTWNVQVDPRSTAVRPVRYGDIMALVRRRTHLAVYERALRCANVPYITSRQGGLLDTLEADDLSALLQFLISPFDDLKLAQALRSPIFALTDDDLIAIAATPGSTWWDRLVDLAAAGASPALERAATLLGRWRERADTQPVHDQLDRIFFEGDILSRYASAVPSAMRAAVIANLQAYIQHALDADAGRYPSLPRFIDELRELRAAPVEEAPDEGILGAYGDSLRILTVHGAKGLEAPIVWLLDATATRAADGGYDAMVDWPPGARAPESFSLRTRIKAQSAHQRLLADREERRAQREDLNLLYVAMTRAQQALLVSGCATAGAAQSWYALVRGAVCELAGSDPAAAQAVAYGDDLAAGERLARAPVVAPSRDPSDVADATQAPMPTGTRRADVRGPGQAFGTAFHRLMERLAVEPARSAESLRRQLRLPREGYDALWSQARRVLNDPALAPFFDPLLHQRAHNELSIVTATGELRRLDRVVEFDAEVWILDYKTGAYAAVAGTALESEYRAQIAAYCAALQQVYAGKVVRGALLFADGSRIDVT